jgi:hypothetical protein
MKDIKELQTKLDLLENQLHNALVAHQALFEAGNANFELIESFYNDIILPARNIESNIRNCLSFIESINNGLSVEEIQNTFDHMIELTKQKMPDLKDEYLNNFILVKNLIILTLPHIESTLNKIEVIYNDILDHLETIYNDVFQSPFILK